MKTVFAEPTSAVSNRPLGSLLSETVSPAKIPVSTGVPVIETTAVPSYALSSAASPETVSARGETTTVRSTVTGMRVTLPGWRARNTKLPAPTNDTVPPWITPGPLSTEMVTGRPELALAETAKGASPYCLATGASKETDCGSLLSVIVLTTGTAGAIPRLPDCAACT